MKLACVIVVCLVVNEVLGRNVREVFLELVLDDEPHLEVEVLVHLAAAHSARVGEVGVLFAFFRVGFKAPRARELAQFHG